MKKYSDEEQRARHNAKNREWAKNNPEKMREARKRWITANPEKNKAMQKEIQHRSYIKHREEIRGRQKILNMKRKEKVASAYGGKCACCGEDRIEFLAIDHIEGGGNLHRREANLQPGTQFYCWLIREGFPDGFQVLCYNCNNAKAIYGVCPHQRNEGGDK